MKPHANQLWADNLRHFFESRKTLEGFSGTLEVKPPLTEEGMAKLGKKIRLPLPEVLKEFWLQACGGCSFDYTYELGEAAGAQAEEIGIDATELRGCAVFCDSSTVLADLKECKAWAEETWIAEEADQQELWLGCIPIAALSSGDYLGVRADGIADPAVVYLNHEEGSQVIAPSFTQFLQNWANLCYIGPEIWMIESFLNPDTGCLDAESDSAKTLRQIFSEQEKPEPLG